MAEARVESIDALKSFKTALIKFAEGANVALGDAESDVTRTINWLEGEQLSFWQTQVRKRSDLVGRCQEAVRMKRIYKDASGRPQSAIEEEKALKIAQRQLEEAQLKVVAVRKAIQRLDKQFPLYKGTVQRFASDVVVTVPTATAHLENLIRSLEAYTSLASPTEATSTAAVASDAGTGVAGESYQSMTRSADADEPKAPETRAQENGQEPMPAEDAPKE